MQKYIFLLGWLVATQLAAQDQMDDVNITASELAPGIFMLQGQGGNIGVSIGADGTFLIDDQFAPLTDRIIAEIINLGGGVPKFLINTHWHADHTGGNENLGKAGTVILAHDNVRKTMAVDNMITSINSSNPAATPEALPVITFGDDVTLHLNGETIHAWHVHAAHTDGDSVVYFEKANVLHTGDVYFNGFYPFIDVEHGGSLLGMAQAAAALLEKIDAHTVIIPGHGPASNKTELQAYADMLATMSKRIAKLKAAGKTIDEIVASRPSADFDKEWGDGFMKPDPWVRVISQ